MAAVGENAASQVLRISRKELERLFMAESRRFLFSRLDYQQ